MEMQEIEAMAEFVNFEKHKVLMCKNHMAKWERLYGVSPTKFQEEKDHFEALQNTEEYFVKVRSLFDKFCELLTLKEQNFLVSIIELKNVTDDTDEKGRKIADYALGYVHGHEGSDGERTLF